MCILHGKCAQKSIKRLFFGADNLCIFGALCVERGNVSSRERVARLESVESFLLCSSSRQTIHFYLASHSTQQCSIEYEKEAQEQ